MMALVNYLNEKNDDYMMDVKAELEAELNRGAEKAQKNRELYESVKPIVFDGLREAGKAVPLSELFDEIETRLPECFGKSKVQHAITRLWNDEIGKNSDGKVNTYALKVEGE